MADATLPFILAGPILRRVEPRLVAVWMALSEPRALQLNVFEGRQQTGTGKFVFLGGPIVRGAANTLRFGAKLHVGVVVAEIGGPPAQALTPGLNYFYNVLFAPFVESEGQGAKLDPASLKPTDDLKKRGLLLNEPVEGKPHEEMPATCSRRASPTTGSPSSRSASTRRSRTSGCAARRRCSTRAARPGSPARSAESSSRSAAT